MCPIEALEEPDEPWEFDRLLQVRPRLVVRFLVLCALTLHSPLARAASAQEVSQALQAEADQKEAEEGGLTGSGGAAAGGGSGSSVGTGSTVIL